MSSQAQLSDAFTDLSSIDAGQARECARALLRTPLIRPDGPDGHLLPTMYRHREVLQAVFSSYLGYPLTIERRFAQRTASEVGALLGRSLTRHVGRTTKVDLAELDQLLRNGPAQRGLADIVASLTGQPLLQRQAERAEQATHRSAQEHEASRLVSELAPYPAARLLVDLLSGPGGLY